MKKFVLFIFLSFFIVGNVYAMNTYYNNKVPYSSLFTQPQQKKIKVQKEVGKGNVVQTIISVNTEKTDIEQPKKIKKGE